MSFIVFLDPLSNGFLGPQTTCSFGYTTLDALSDSRWQEPVAHRLSVPPAISPQANAPYDPWQAHPSMTALQTSLQITADCWALLAAPDGTCCKHRYLPKGEREPETAYRKRLEAARPSGFFRDAQRIYAGMLSRGSWISLPASLSSVLTDVDGRVPMNSFSFGYPAHSLVNGSDKKLPRLATSWFAGIGTPIRLASVAGSLHPSAPA